MLPFGPYVCACSHEQFTGDANEDLNAKRIQASLDGSVGTKRKNEADAEHLKRILKSRERPCSIRPKLRSSRNASQRSVEPARQSGRSASACGWPERVAQVRIPRTAPPDQPAADPSSLPVSRLQDDESNSFHFNRRAFQHNPPEAGRGADWSPGIRAVQDISDASRQPFKRERLADQLYACIQPALVDDGIARIPRRE
jgi:hypothetical protein